MKHRKRRSDYGKARPTPEQRAMGERMAQATQMRQVSPRRTIGGSPTPWVSRFDDREIQEALRRDSNRPRSRDGRRKGNQYTRSSPRLRGGVATPTRNTTDSGGEGLRPHPQLPFGTHGFVTRYREEA